MDMCDLASEQEFMHDNHCIKFHEDRILLTGTIVEDVNGNRLCEDCGNPIPEKRLKYVPYTTRCVNCQQLFESEYN